MNSIFYAVCYFLKVNKFKKRLDIIRLYYKRSQQILLTVFYSTIIFYREEF